MNVALVLRKKPPFKSRIPCSHDHPEVKCHSLSDLLAVPAVSLPGDVVTHVLRERLEQVRMQVHIA